MKEYTKRLDAYGLTELASISQHGSQYGNPCITLYEVPEGHDSDLPAGTKILNEDTGADTTRYIIDASDMGDSTPQKYVDDCAREWASNEDNYQLELCLWGLSEPEDWAASDRATPDNAPCNVVIKQSFFGPYYPTGFASDERGDVREFENRTAAQAWIDEQEQATYYLAHNEVGRPTYAIWEA